MALSIWRYCHWILAISTSVFIGIASITGLVLALEPISNQLKPYAVSGNSEQSIAELSKSLSSEFDEVVSVEVDDNKFLRASVLTLTGKSETVYIDPDTGKKLGNLSKRAWIYDFATNLHRSLFLKSTGRFIIGLVSFLMVIILISGMVLIAKRQGGFKRWFSSVVRARNDQY